MSFSLHKKKGIGIPRQRTHILTPVKEGTDCSIIAISLREGLNFQAYMNSRHPLASEVERRENEGTSATFTMGWKLVKAKGLWQIKSERFKEHICDIHLSQPRLLNRCFSVSSGTVSDVAKTCNFSWREISGLQKETLLELSPLFTIFGKADSIFIFGKTVTPQSSSEGEVIIGRSAMYFNVALNTRKLLYFYETNRAQWLKYNYGPKKALQVCEKTPKLSTCCAIVGLEEMHVKAQADEDLFTLLCS